MSVSAIKSAAKCRCKEPKIRRRPSPKREGLGGGESAAMRHLHYILLAMLLLGFTNIPISAQAPSAPTFQVYLPVIVRLTNANNLELTTATYLGGTGADSANAIDIANNGLIVMGGSLTGFSPTGATLVTLPGAGSGAVVRLSSDGRTALSITRIGNSVADLGLTSDDRIGVCGDFGVALLNADASATIWSAAIGAASRCAIGSDGTIAVLVSKTVSIYASDGSLIRSLTIADNPLDLTIDTAGSQVIVVGWRQITSTLQMPFIRAYGFDGTQRWTSYDYAAGTPNIGSADTRAEQIALGRDGKLYVSFSINGGTGVSVLARDPKNAALSAADRTVVTDKYTNPFNIGSVKMAWLGRFNLSNGQLEQGQSLLTRLTSNDRGNSISIRAIAADEQGRVVIAGDTACCIMDRDTRQVAFTTVGGYEIGEAYVLTLSADFRARTAWTVFTAPGTSAGSSPANGVALRGGKVAMAATLNQGTGATRGLITFKALQPTLGSATASDGYLAVWTGP